VQDLRSVIAVLKNYRDQNHEAEIDFSLAERFLSSNDRGKRRIINSHLRDRLFDMSKRNKLIHFRTTMQTVNLTVSSVPLMLDYKNIKEESLFTWQPRIADWLANEKTIPLDRYLKFEDAPYLLHSLISKPSIKKINNYNTITYTYNHQFYHTLLIQITCINNLKTLN